MSSTTHDGFVHDSWQSPRNARTLRVFMALRNHEIGARIKSLRANRGNPPQPTVALAIGVAERTYQTWESGEAKPSYRNLQKIAEYYSVSESYILEGVDDRPVVEGVPEQLEQVSKSFDERVTEIEKRQQHLVETVDKIYALVRRLVREDVPAPPADLGRRAAGGSPTPPTGMSERRRRVAGSQPDTA